MSIDVDKEMFKMFCKTMNVFKDVEIENIVTRLVSVLKLEKEEDLKELQPPEIMTNDCF